MGKRELWTVYLKFKSYGLNPCTFPVFVAFSYAAAHQFFADQNYPRSYGYFVREKRLPVYEDKQPSFDSVLDTWDGGLG